LIATTNKISLIKEGPDEFIWPYKPIAWGRSPVYEVVGKNYDANGTDYVQSHRIRKFSGASPAEYLDNSL
jgi:hypothetical protein